MEPPRTWHTAKSLRNETVVVVVAGVFNANPIPLKTAVLYAGEVSSETQNYEFCNARLTIAWASVTMASKCCWLVKLSA